MSIIAKYKFDKSIYTNLIPRFNEGFTGYNIRDEIDSVNSNYIIRTIECNTLPSFIKFGFTNHTPTNTEAAAKSLIELLELNISGLNNLTHLFCNCNRLTSVNTSNWDTSRITTMNGMFDNCQSLTSIDVSNFDTSNVTTMDHMFYKCTSLTSIDVSNFDTSNVNYMDYMFNDCQSLPSLNVSNFNTSNVTNMQGMFQDCYKLTSIDVSNWDTSRVKDMSEMFSYCYSLENIDVSRWNTSNVTIMKAMFHECRALTSIDISNWNTSNVIDMYAMFWSCYSLTSIDFSNLDTSKVVDMGRILGCYTEGPLEKLRTVNMNNINLNENNKIDGRLLQYRNLLTKIYLNDIDTIKIIIEHLPDRISSASGYIVTPIRDQIDEETLAALTAKNWVVKDLVTQYVYDANTYENLIPEFNAEFTSDKYEIYDSVSDIVIDDIVWTPGCITNNGENGIIPVEFPNAVRTDSYLPILDNVSYKSNFDLNYSFYDENKNHISTTHVVENTYIVSPTNAKYVRLYRGTLENTMRVTAKIITRSIESKNGDLPTLMRFGTSESVTDRSKSLLKLLSLNTNNLNILNQLCMNCKRVTEINTSNWDTSKVTEMMLVFNNCGLLSKLDVSKFDVSKVTSMRSMFADCNSLTELDLSNWKTTEVLDDVSNLFDNCYLIKKIDLSGFNTSNVFNFTNLFCDCHALEEIEGLYSFDTSNAELFQGLFARCHKLQHINGIENWNTSKATNFHYVFGDEQENPRVGIDITNWSLANSDYYTTFFSNHTNLRYLKCDNTETINKLTPQIPIRTADKPGYIVCRTGAANLDTTALNDKNWKVIKYLVADYTFDKTIHVNPIPTFNGEYTGYTIVDEVDSTNANHVNRIIVSNTLPTKMRFGNNDSNATSVRCMVRIDRLDCSALSDAYIMFKHCANLTGIYTRFNVNENLSTVEGMFGGCASIKNIDVTGLISSNVTTMTHLFDGCVNLSSIKGMDTWNTSGSTSMRCLFEDCISLTSLDVSNFNTSNVIDMKGMFGGVEGKFMSLTEIKGLENFNTSNVQDMSYMFCKCNKLTEINVSNFDTSSVNIIDHMFYQCESVTSLDVGHFNVSNVTNLWSMFELCNKVSSLDVSKWDTSNVTNMVRVFNLCTQLRSLDVSNWDVGKVTNLEACFGGCTNLPKLDVSRWNTSNVTNMANATQNLYKVTSLDVSNWDTSKAYNIGGIFDDLGIGVSTPKKIDLSNWDTSSAMYIGWLLYSSDAIASGWKYNIQELNITNIDLSKVITTENLISTIYAETLENPIIRCNVVNTIKIIAEYLPSRASLSTPGYIVTTMKDEIDEPTVELLTSKNWLIREMIAQYVFDANTYEDLMPEFNPEFTEDKYEVYDSVSDIVIDNMVLEVGAINGENGYNINNDSPALIVSNCNRTNYLSIIPNTTYSFNYEHVNMVMFDWYDENKKFISQEYIDYNEFVITSPINAKYLRMWANKRSLNENKRTLTAKLVTRTIESKNGELPTLMRFGYGGYDLIESNIPKHLSLIKILGLNTKELTTAFRMFKYCKRLSTVQSNWNTSKITDMFAMFFECHKLTSLDVSNWDTSNVIEMHGLFNGCHSLTSLDVNNWDVRKVKAISQMFLACASLKSMDLSNWQTDSLEQMYRLFQGCHNLVSVNINNLNISKVKTLEETFKDCHRLASLELSNWDTSSINNIRNMFTACRTLTSLDLNNWDTSNVTLMDRAFYNCENLVSVNISDWDTSKVTYMHSLFHNCKKLTTVDVSRWNVGNVIRMDNLFNSCNELVSIDVSNWNTSNVQNMGCLFGWCFKLQSVDLSNWDTSKVVYMNYMFSECNELTSIGDTSNWDTGNVTNMEWMFDKCYKLSSLNVSNWDTSNVTDMTYMFDSCKSLTSLDVSKWDTGNVRGMRNTFNNCRSLTSLDVHNWDVSKVGETYAMFSDCVSLTDLDLTNWNMSKVNNIGYMFDGKELGASINMPILDLTSLDWSLVTDMQGAFYKNNAKAIKLPRIINPNLLSVISERNEGAFGLFHCPNLISLDFGGLDLSNLDSFSTANKHLVLAHVPKLRYIRTENAALIADLAQYFPARTEAEQGYLITKASISDEIRTMLAGKYWNIIDLEECILIAKYKFNTNVYKNNVPIFNSQFVDFFIEDEIENENESNIVTRSIFSINDIPTNIQFGVHWITESYELKHYPRTHSLRAVEYLNTSRIVSTNNMFRHCRNVTNIYTSNWETGNFTDLNSTFENCSILTSLDVSGWITDKVTTMEDMFRGCENLKTINGIENWNTDKVTTMMGMFQHCKVLSSINLSNFDTRNVNNMSNMFYQCHAITSLDVSGFDTSNVTTMQNMFLQCYNLTSIDVSNWDTSKVLNMGGMFSDCRSLTSLDVSNFDTSNVTYMAYMFQNCNKLTSLDVSNFDTSKVTNIGFMFCKCTSLTSLDVSNFDTSKVTNMQEAFRDCHSLTSLDVSKWNTSKVVTAHQLFGLCKNLTSIDVSKWDTSNMVDIAGIFWHCYKLEYIDVSGWNIEQVGLWENGLNHIFYNCVSLKQLDLSSFKTINCKKIGGFISSCGNLEYLDISNFDLHLIENGNMALIENVTKLANIGMIYCDFKTVEKIASVLPINNRITIWVGNHIDINGLPQYDHITYKVYEVEDNLEVELSSPLLEGDRLEIIDGDLYHYHKMNMFTVDKNDHDSWRRWTTNSTVQEELDEMGHVFFIDNKVANELGAKQFTDGYCSAMIYDGRQSNINDHTQVFDHVRMSCWLPADGAPNHRFYCFTNEKYDNTNDFKQYIHKLYPFDVAYILDKPYYELVKPNVGLLNAEQGLYLNISDSVVPVVNHQDLCTLKLNYLLPNVEYKVKFKANNAGSIAINLGGTLVPLDIVEGWNEVMVTTPETLVDEYLKVNGSEDIKIQNVMVIDSNKDFDYFKGMNNTFDEIPVKNICTNRTLTYTHGVDRVGVSPQGEMNVNVNKGKVVTVLGRVSNNPDNLPISINLYNDTGRATGKNLFNPEMYKNVPMSNGTCTLTAEGSLIVRPNQIAPDTFIDNYMNIGVGAGSVGKPISDSYKKYLIPVNGGGLYTFSTIIPDWYNTKGGFSSYDAYVQCYDSDYTLLLSDTYQHTGFIGRNLIQDKGNHDDAYYYTQFNLPANTAYVLCRLDVNAGIETTTFTNILFEKGETVYEPFRNYVNDEPIFINPDENGNFVVQIKADRDHVNRIGFNVGDASSCEANDQVTITDLMVFEGDILDCHPTTYVDPADTRYLVEYKTIGNPFGFGKNKLI